MGTLEGRQVRGELGLLRLELRCDLLVDLVEDVERARVWQCEAPRPQVDRELLGLGLDGGVVVLVCDPVARQVGLDPLDRVLELPALEVLSLIHISEPTRRTPISYA